MVPSWVIYVRGIYTVKTYDGYILWLILMIPPYAWIATGLCAIGGLVTLMIGETPTIYRKE